MNDPLPNRVEPDVRLFRDQDLPETPFPGGRGQDFRVYLSPEVYKSLWAHAAEDTTVEICGVLVGTWARDADGAFVQITDAIRGEAARNKFAEVTFTHETWSRINEEMDKRFADRAIVGWYHTHPDFGVFLSDRDRFIQEHFFSGAGQIALVIDPIRVTVGAFAWREGKPTLCPHVWVGDGVVLGTAAGAEAPRAAVVHAEEAPARGRGGPARESALSPLSAQLLMYLALFLLGYLLAGFRSSWEQARMAEGVVAHYGVWRGLRPGLHQGLDALSDRLALLTPQINSLSADHLQRLKDQKGAKDQVRHWEQVRSDLSEAAHLVDEIDRLYSLSPEEDRAVRELVLESLRSLSDPRTKAGSGRLASEVPKNSSGADVSGTPPPGVDRAPSSPVTKAGSPKPPEPPK